MGESIGPGGGGGKCQKSMGNLGGNRGANMKRGFSWGRGEGRVGGNTTSLNLQYHIFGYPYIEVPLKILVPNI